MNGFDDIQKFSKDNVEVALTSAGVVSKGCQAIATEAADFSRKSLEAGSSAFEKMLSAQSLDKAVEVQSEYVRTAYESYVGQVTKVGEIVAEMTKNAYKPYENFLGGLGK